jgi:hypothetical protein
MWVVIVDLEKPIKDKKDICYDNNSSAFYARRQLCTYVNARLKEVYVEVSLNQVFQGFLCRSGYVDKKRVTRPLLFNIRVGPLFWIAGILYVAKTKIVEQYRSLTSYQLLNVETH